MERSTPNLPSRDFAATVAFYAALGFGVDYRDTGWMILSRGPLIFEFFVHPRLVASKSWFSACIRVDDLDSLYAAFQRAGLSANPRDIPRLTPPKTLPGVPRMFALIDRDGSLIRCLENPR